MKMRLLDRWRRKRDLALTENEKAVLRMKQEGDETYIWHLYPDEFVKACMGLVEKGYVSARWEVLDETTGEWVPYEEN